MYKEIYNNIQKSCCYITVFLGDEIISEGTGFAFTDYGQVITAAHVVTGRFPIKAEDYTDPDVRIFVKFPSVELLEYKVAFCGFNIQCDGFKEDLQLDISVIVPKQELNKKFNFLPANINPPELGEELFIAGFSDELHVSFGLEKLMKNETLGVNEFHSAMEKGYMADMMGALIKRAVVGNARKIESTNTSENLRVTTDSLYLDNGMHSGASGGPLVNKEGVAVGVITQRAITNASQSSDPNLKVPSGSTICISLGCLPIVNHMLAKRS